MQQVLQLNKNKVQGALWGCFIGDALAMPCHWYYNLQKLQEDFQEIKKYQAPKDSLIGSYVVLSVLGQVPQGNLIGDVIMHDRRQFYKETGQYHYHHGMKAGENTLEARLMNLLLQTLCQSKYICDDIKYRDEYVKFMTTPGTHNDTYANSAHRLFFTNWANQKSLDDCPSLSVPAIDSIDGLVNSIPIILATSSMSKGEQEQLIKKITFTIRKSDKLLEYAFLLNELIQMVLQGKDLRQAIEIICLRINLDIKGLVQNEAQVAGCPLEKSFPATLFYAYKYAHDPNEALLASTNGGGENVSRGIVLGAIMGATHGMDQWRSDFITDLVDHDKYKQSIDEFIVWLQDIRSL